MAYSDAHWQTASHLDTMHSVLDDILVESGRQLKACLSPTLAPGDGDIRQVVNVVNARTKHRYEAYQNSLSQIIADIQDAKMTLARDLQRLKASQAPSQTPDGDVSSAQPPAGDSDGADSSLQNDPPPQATSPTGQTPIIAIGPPFASVETPTTAHMTAPTTTMASTTAGQPQAAFLGTQTPAGQKSPQTPAVPVAAPSVPAQTRTGSAKEGLARAGFTNLHFRIAATAAAEPQPQAPAQLLAKVQTQAQTQPGGTENVKPGNAQPGRAPDSGSAQGEPAGHRNDENVLIFHPNTLGTDENNSGLAPMANMAAFADMDMDGDLDLDVFGDGAV